MIFVLRKPQVLFCGGFDFLTIISVSTAVLIARTCIISYVTSDYFMADIVFSAFVPPVFFLAEALKILYTRRYDEVLLFYAWMLPASRVRGRISVDGIFSFDGRPSRPAYAKTSILRRP